MNIYKKKKRERKKSKDKALVTIHGRAGLDEHFYFFGIFLNFHIVCGGTNIPPISVLTTIYYHFAFKDFSLYAFFSFYTNCRKR